MNCSVALFRFCRSSLAAKHFKHFSWPSSRLSQLSFECLSHCVWSHPALQYHTPWLDELWIGLDWKEKSLHCCDSSSTTEEWQHFSLSRSLFLPLPLLLLSVSLSLAISSSFPLCPDLFPFILRFTQATVFDFENPSVCSSFWHSLDMSSFPPHIFLSVSIAPFISISAAEDQQWGYCKINPDTTFAAAEKAEAAVRRY